MSKAKKVSHLGLVFIVGLLSAGAAVYLMPHISPFAEENMIVRGAEGDDMTALMAYTAGFVASFLVFSFVGHHVSLRVSIGAKGYEKAAGLAPFLARFILVAFLFGLPLSYLMHQSGALGWMMDMRREARNEKTDAPRAKEVGYKKEDREKIEALISTGAQND